MTEAVTGDGPTVVEVEVPTEDVSRSFSGPFFRAVGKRKQQDRDAKILVTAKDAQTGVGKSNLCDFLAYVLDTTDEGFVPHKITIEPEEFFSAYGRLEPGSALVMEEGEQLDPRRSMSKKNVEASHSWQMERVREVVALINLPSPKFIDKRMEELADYWVRGAGPVPRVCAARCLPCRRGRQRAGGGTHPRLQPGLARRHRRARPGV